MCNDLTIAIYTTVQSLGYKEEDGNIVKSIFDSFFIFDILK